MTQPGKPQARLVELSTREPIWDRFFWVAPLVLVGTMEADGSHDLAPKHMAFPMGWENYFGFVCTPRHGTYQNILRDGMFTVSYPRPDQLVHVSLAASPRAEDGQKSALSVLPVVPASKVDGVLVDGAYLHLECELDRIIDGFGDNSLIAGRVVAARVDENAECLPDLDEQQLLHDNPLLVYIHPTRFAAVGDSLSFPFPRGMKK